MFEYLLFLCVSFCIKPIWKYLLLPLLFIFLSTVQQTQNWVLVIMVSEKKLSIDQLDSPLIGEIASLLYQKSHALFSRTNKRILAACNSPNRLREVSLDDDDIMILFMFPNCVGTDYSTINLSNYHSVEHLRISLHKFSQLQWNESVVVGRHLKSLTIETTAIGHSCPSDESIYDAATFEF